MHAPDTPTLNIIIFNVYTGYLLHSPYHDKQQRWQLKKKGSPDIIQIQGFPTAT